MTMIELIRWALGLTDTWFSQTAEDLRDAPLAQPTAHGGNHPLWTVGHVAWVEGGFRAMLFGEPNPLEHWKPMFGMGTEPMADATGYPTYEEIVAAYHELRAGNLARLATLSDDDLAGSPARPPERPEAAELWKTKGQMLLMLALHQMIHLGQLTVVRRALGRPYRF
jgi:uncharacterized damage-inducible protein DinB